MFPEFLRFEPVRGSGVASHPLVLGDACGAFLRDALQSVGRNKIGMDRHDQRHIPVLLTAGAARISSDCDRSALASFTSSFFTTALPMKLVPLEWVLNMPTHHSMHHASNESCLDASRVARQATIRFALPSRNGGIFGRTYRMCRRYHVKSFSARLERLTQSADR